MLSLCRPVGLVKCVPVQPSALALSFIISTKVVMSLGIKSAMPPLPTYPAKIMADSLPLCTRAEVKSCRMVSRSPTIRPPSEALVPYSISWIHRGYSAVSPSRSFTFSSTSMAVIILVSEAGYIFSSAFFSYSTRPVSRFSR